MSLPLKILLGFLLVIFLIVVGKKALRMERASYPLWVIFYVLAGMSFYPVMEGGTSLLRPFLLFSLGAVGFLEGASLDFSRLRGRLQIGRSVVYFLPTLAFFFILSWFFTGDLASCIIFSVSVSLVSLYGIKSYMKITVALWELLAIPFLAVAFSLGRGNILSSLFYHLGLALAFGVIAYLVMGIRSSEGEKIALLLGLILFSSGTASYLLLSPIFVGFGAGLLYSNLPKMVGMERFIPKLISLEKPVFTFLLLYLGLNFPAIASWKGVKIAALFFVAKSIYGFALRETGFLSLSPLSVAILLSFSSHFPGKISAPLFSSFVILLLLLEAEEFVLGVKEERRRTYARR